MVPCHLCSVEAVPVPLQRQTARKAVSSRAGDDGSGIRMGAPDGCTGVMTFGPTLTWGMDPVDPAAPYVFEVASTWWHGMNRLIRPHGRTRANFLSAGLGVFSIDFTSVPLSVWDYRINTDPSALWYRVQRYRTDWPSSTVKRWGGEMVQ